MPCIILVGGGIGCGKTTFINYLVQNQSDLLEHSIPDSVDSSFQTIINNKSLNNESKFYALHFDDLCSIEEQEQLMKSLRGWRNFRIDLLMAFERLISSFSNSVSCLSGPLTKRSTSLLDKLSSLNFDQNGSFSNAIILVEDNFYYRSMRYDWFQVARRASFGFGTIFLTCPLHIAVERNSCRGYHIPEARIKKMLSFIEFPEPVKYKWEKYSLILNTSEELNKLSMGNVMKLITEAMSHPAEAVLLEQKIEAQRICSKNVIHQADRILRKILSKKISLVKGSIPEENLKPVVSQLVKIRHKMLLHIKNGDIDLPQELVDKIQNLGIESVLESYEECLENLFNLTLQEKSLESLTDDL